MSLITPNSQIKLYSDVEITDGLEIVLNQKQVRTLILKAS